MMRIGRPLVVEKLLVYTMSSMWRKGDLSCNQAGLDVPVDLARGRTVAVTGFSIAAHCAPAHTSSQAAARAEMHTPDRRANLITKILLGLASRYPEVLRRSHPLLLVVGEVGFFFWRHGCKRGQKRAENAEILSSSLSGHKDL